MFINVYRYIYIYMGFGIRDGGTMGDSMAGRTAIDGFCLSRTGAMGADTSSSSSTCCNPSTCFRV